MLYWNSLDRVGFFKLLYKGIFFYLCQFKAISLAFLNTVLHYQEYPWTLSHNIVGHSLVWSFVGYVWSFQTESIEIELFFSSLFQNLSNGSDVLIWNLQIIVLVLNKNNQPLLNNTQKLLFITSHFYIMVQYVNFYWKPLASHLHSIVQSFIFYFFIVRHWQTTGCST